MLSYFIFWCTTSNDYHINYAMLHDFFLLNDSETKFRNENYETFRLNLVFISLR